MFLGLGISVILGIFGIGLLIGSNYVFDYAKNFNYSGGWIMAIVGSVLIFPLVVRILISLDIK